MKTKDVLYIILAGIIFSVAGVIGFKQLAPKNAKEVQVEVVTPIEPDFNQDALRQVTDGGRAKDFMPSIDIHNGLDNNKPFNPI
jgi:hypothetical protein